MKNTHFIKIVRLLIIITVFLICKPTFVAADEEEGMTLAPFIFCLIMILLWTVMTTTAAVWRWAGSVLLLILGIQCQGLVWWTRWRAICRW